MKTVTKILKGLSFAVIIAASGVAAAQEAPSSSPAAAPEEALAEAEILSGAELEALAGGTNLHPTILTDQTLSAFNGGNAVIGDSVGSGQINLGSNAFAGYSGVGNFVLNTGHNNNLQSSMNVSILLAQPGN